MSSVRVVKQSATWELPDEGLHVAVLTTVTNLGIVKPRNPNWETRPKARLEFALDQNGSDGRPLTVRDEVTVSLNQEANLTEYVDALTSNADIPDGVTVEIEDLVGYSCQLFIQHSKPNAKGRQWANIAKALPLPAGVAPLPLPATVQSLAAPPATVQQPAPVATPAALWAPQPATQSAAAPTWRPPATPSPASNSYVVGANKTTGGS
jgi:hypothetical protein